MSFGSSPKPDYNMVAGQNAYNAASQGQDWGTIASNSVGYEDAARAGYDKYANEQAQSRMFEQMFMGMMQPQSSGTSVETQQQRYQDSLDKQQAEYDARLEEQRVITGQNARDTSYAGYLDAAGIAADYVTGEIANERSNAALLGIDYDITDEQKSTRINDYFATLWGEGQQSEMENLFNEWGNPQGFGGFSVTRGNAETYAAKSQPAETLATSKGLRPQTSLATEEDETLGAPSGALGV